MLPDLLNSFSIVISNSLPVVKFLLIASILNAAQSSGLILNDVCICSTYNTY